MTTIEPATTVAASGLDAAVAEFLVYLEARNYATGSITAYGHALGLLAGFLAERGINDPSEVTAESLESYRQHLRRLTSRQGRPLSVATQSHRLQAVRVLFRWAFRSQRIPHNPAEGLEPPVAEHRLPPATLTVAEIEAIMAIPDTATVIGLRDRAILETFYSSGIRRSELIALKLTHVDRGRGTLFISQAKGHKDRYVPIGTRAIYWLDRYLTCSRPHLARPHGLDNHSVFLAYTGRGLSRDYVSELVTRHIDASGIAKHGSCHLLRHSAATLMLEGGADIRYIAELLGHSRLETTQRYTRVSIHQLRQVHSHTHPGANLPPKKADPPTATIRK